MSGLARSIALAGVLVVWAPSALGDDAPTERHWGYAGLRGGFFAGVESESIGPQVQGPYGMTYGTWADASGRGLILGGVLIVGDSNFRWINKIENMDMFDPDSGIADAGMLVVTTGVQYNSAHDQSLGFVGEASVGLTFGYARDFDCKQSGLIVGTSGYAPNCVPVTTTMFSVPITVNLAAGARVIPELEILMEFWAGFTPSGDGAGGIAIVAGTEFAL